MPGYLLNYKPALSRYIRIKIENKIKLVLKITVDVVTDINYCKMMSYIMYDIVKTSVYKKLGEWGPRLHFWMG